MSSLVIYYIYFGCEREQEMLALGLCIHWFSTFPAGISINKSLVLFIGDQRTIRRIGKTQDHAFVRIIGEK